MSILAPHRTDCHKNNKHQTDAAQNLTPSYQKWTSMAGKNEK
jgi:hypothetical protein